MIQCPNCGKSHYSEKYSMRTAMYYPPVWKNGINVNPDGNFTTTYCYCCECHHNFIVKIQYGEVVSITDDGEFKPDPIVKKADAPKDITAIAVKDAMINIDPKPIAPHYAWESDIQELKEQVADLKKQIAELAGEVYALQ